MSSEQQTGNEHEVDIRVVVNGAETVVRANAMAPLRTVIVHAIDQTHNQGRQLSEWELRDAAGNALDPDRPIGSYGFGHDVVLYLQPTVGVNGFHTPESSPSIHGDLYLASSRC